MKRSPFKRKVILYISFALLSLILFSGINYLHTLSVVKKETRLTNQSILRQIKSNVEMNISHIERISYNLVQNIQFLSFVDSIEQQDSFDAYQAQQMLYHVMLTNDYIQSIYVYIPSAGTVLGTNSCLPLERFEDKGWLGYYEKLKGFYGLFSRYMESEDREYLTVTLVREISTFSNGETKGAIIINIDPSLLASAFQSDSVNEIMKICITDNVDTLLYNNQSKDYKVQPITYRPFDTSAEPGILSFREDGKATTFYYDVSEIFGIHYYIAVPKSVMISYYLTGTILMIVFFVILAMTILAMQKFNMTALRPIEGFVNNLTDYVRQNYDDSPATTDAEYKDLKDIYNWITENDRRMNEQIANSLPAMRWRVLMTILTGEETVYENISHRLQILNMSLHAQNYIVILTEIDTHNEIMLTMPVNTISVYLDMICREIDKLADGEAVKVLSMKMQDDKIVSVFSFREGKVEENINEVLSYANILQANVTAQMNLTISIGVGGFYVNLENISNSYQEAEYALGYKFLIGSNAIISIEDIVFTDRTDIEDIITLIEKIKIINADELTGHIELIYEKMQQRKINPSIFNQLAVHMTMNIFANNQVLEVKKSVLECGQYKDIYYRISQLDTIGEAKSYMLNLISDSLELLDIQKNNIQNNKLVNEIIQCMNDHYMDSNLSLNYMADMTKCSTAHISRLFKEVTKVNFIDYLTDMRMNKAKELLTNSKHRISDISIMVGYVNVNSFMRVFKRSTGKTPSEYRKENGI